MYGRPITREMDMTRQTMLDKPAFISWVRGEFLLSRAEISALSQDDLEDCYEQWLESRTEEVSVFEYFEHA